MNLDLLDPARSSATYCTSLSSQRFEPFFLSHLNLGKYCWNCAVLRSRDILVGAGAEAGGKIRLRLPAPASALDIAEEILNDRYSLRSFQHWLKANDFV